MARRRFQRGSLKDDGDRWVIRWYEDAVDPVTGEASRPYKWDVLSKKAFPTKRLAQRELERRLSSVNSIDYRPTASGTFSAFAERWKKTVMPMHKPSAQKSDQTCIRKIEATFGNCPLSTISAEAVQAWVTSLDVGPKTTRNVVAMFSGMWKTSKAWGYVQHDPFVGLRLPRKEKGKVHHFTLEQQLAIIAAAKRPWHKLLFRLLGESGLRPGEAVGLRTEDIGHASIRVVQSFWKGKPQTPKTENAIREIPVSSSLIRLIQKHIEESESNDYDLVFVNEKGTPINTDHFRWKVLVPILKSLGIKSTKQCGLYSFRHGHGSLLDTLRVPLKIRQERMGHADAETTLNHYTEASTPEARAVGEQIGALYETGGIVQ